MKRKIIYALCIIPLVIGVLSVSIVCTDDTKIDLSSDKVINTDAQINPQTPSVDVSYEVNDDIVDITVFGNYLNRNRLLWATYDENGRLTGIKNNNIFAYPFKYQGELSDNSNRLIIWNDETNSALINKVIKQED